MLDALYPTRGSHRPLAFGAMASLLTACSWPDIEQLGRGCSKDTPATHPRCAHHETSSPEFIGPPERDALPVLKIVADDDASGGQGGQQNHGRGSAGDSGSGSAGSPPLDPGDPSAPEGFDTSPLKAFDQDAYCKWKYSSSAEVVATGPHAYQVGCQHDGSTQAISGYEACERQHGPNHHPVLVGGNTGDWRCLDWLEIENRVLPVVIISADYFYEIHRIREAVDAASAIARNAQTWFEAATGNGSTFTLVQPIVRFSLRYTMEWHAAVCRAAPSDDVEPGARPSDCEDRTAPQDAEALLDVALAEVEPLFFGESGTVPLVVPLFVYTGPYRTAWGHGSAHVFDQSLASTLLVQPPSFSGCKQDDPWCGVYALGHQLGHGFGLTDAAELEPRPEDWTMSIMGEGGSPPVELRLLPQERDILEESPYFRDLNSETEP